MSSDASLSRLALSTRIREEVLARILRGDLKPGERLVEMRLAKEFGTSQAPVREALRELEMSRLVESSRNRGTRVSVTTPEELADIYDVRAELEAYAGELALPHLAERLPALRDGVRTMLTHAAAGDVVGFGEANAKFHQLIVEAAGNSTLLEIWKQLDVRSRSTINLARSAANLEVTALSHQPIIAAVKSGSAPALRQELRDHVRKFRPVGVPNRELV